VSTRGPIGINPTIRLRSNGRVARPRIAQDPAAARAELNKHRCPRRELLFLSGTGLRNGDRAAILEFDHVLDAVPIAEAALR
jgi:hypothetical protein